MTVSIWSYKQDNKIYYISRKQMFIYSFSDLANRKSGFSMLKHQYINSYIINNIYNLENRNGLSWKRLTMQLGQSECSLSLKESLNEFLPQSVVALQPVIFQV